MPNRMNGVTYFYRLLQTCTNVDYSDCRVEIWKFEGETHEIKTKRKMTNYAIFTLNINGQLDFLTLDK